MSTTLSTTQQALAQVTREHLIESHLPLVKSVARRYAGQGADLDDLIQVGSIGLIKAADRFDPKRGNAFASFATPAIEGEIRHHLRDRATTVRVPRDLQDLGKRVRRSQEELMGTLGRAPTVTELADAVSVDELDVERALAARQARDSVPIPDTAAEPFSTAARDDDSDDRLALAERMRVLDDRERQIVYLRFHADMTERQIAREVGISQAHVSRLLKRALAKMRQEPGDRPSGGDTSPETAISPANTDRPDATGAMSGPGVKAAAPAPEPAERKPSPSHSGRFLVRMPSSLHQQLAAAAESEQVSLNRFVIDTLAASLSPDRLDRAVAPRELPAGAPDGPANLSRPNPRTFRIALAANLALIVVTTIVAVVLLVFALEHGL